MVFLSRPCMKLTKPNIISHMMDPTPERYSNPAHSYGGLFLSRRMPVGQGVVRKCVSIFVTEIAPHSFNTRSVTGIRRLLYCFKINEH